MDAPARGGLRSHWAPGATLKLLHAVASYLWSGAARYDNYRCAVGCHELHLGLIHGQAASASHSLKPDALGNWFLAILPIHPCDIKAWSMLETEEFDQPCVTVTGVNL